MKRLIFIIGVMWLLLSSCRHIPLDDIGEARMSVRVVYNWEKAPEANPKEMSIFFYPEDGGYPYRYDLKRDGGEVKLPVGRYRIITYNNDSHSTEQSDYDDFDKHVIFNYDCDLLRPVNGVASRNLLNRLNLNEPVLFAPMERMWGCSELKAEVLNIEGEQVITLYPDKLLCDYKVTFTNVVNIDSPMWMCASLSGLSDAIYMGSCSVSEQSAIFPFLCEKIDDKTVEGTFLTFGNCESVLKEHKVRLIVYAKRYVLDENGEPKLDENGKKIITSDYFVYDDDKMVVTTQVDEAEDRWNVHIIIDGIELPEPVGGGGGMSIDVGNWDTEEWVIEA